MTSVPIDPSPISSIDTRGHWILLALCAAVYLLLFLVFYPPTQGVEDEVGFLNQTLVLSRGSLSAEGAGYDSLIDFQRFKGSLVGIRNPGRPLLNLPLVALGGIDSVFLTGALIHLALTFTGAAILHRMGRSPLWAALILWHPTLALYSRTVMGDSGAALGLLGALLALTTRRHPGIYAGLSIGAAAVMRYQAGMILPFISLAILVDPTLPLRRREALHCLLSGGLVGTAIVFYNLYLYGSPTGIVKGLFGLEYLPANLLFYLPALMAIWPMMLPAPLLDRSRLRYALAAICLPSLGFFLFYYFHDRGTSWLQTMVLGQRLIQLALPAWVLGYAFVIEDRLLPRFSKEGAYRLVRALTATGLVVLAGMNGLMFSSHQRHLMDLLGVKQVILDEVPPGSLVFANSVAAKIIGVPVAPLDYKVRDYDRAAVDSVPAGQRWYLALLGKEGETFVSQEDVAATRRSHACVEISTRRTDLVLLRCES